MASVKSKPPEAPKRTSRSGIRQSFNLASVGKALADVMNKEKEKEKGKSKENKDAEHKKGSGRRQSTATTKGKDDASHRASTVTSTKASPTLDSVSEGKAKDNTPPDQKTVTNTRKTNSSLQRAGRSSVDETGMRITSASTTPTGAAQTTTNKNRSSLTLRPRKPTANSALPKYRPTSVIVEGSAKETRAAVRIGSRRKHSTSEEDKYNSSSETKSINDIPVDMDKANRPISPLPRRASQAGDQSRPGSVECGKRSPPREPCDSVEKSPTTSTPSRKKVQRPRSALPRPSPRGDTSSESPHTPSSAKKIVSRYLSGFSGGRESPSPLRASATSNGLMCRNTITSAKKVPTVSLSDSNENTPTGPQSETQGSSGNDSADDVEMMLAAVASPSAPTPALPRIGLPCPPLVSTPSKKSVSILDLSLGISTPQSERLSVPSSRRSTPNRRPTVDRNSTVAWQALADLSLEINADQIQGGLIKELDLPATPLGLISPSPSIIRMESDDGHERSPTPLNMPSPSKYGSISQLLLPTVTPFPPPLGNNHSQGNRRLKNLSSGSDGSAAESAAVTLLRLQLASMENIAKERLVQISKLEEQMHALKESRKRDERELLAHVNELEQRLHEAVVSQRRARSRSMSISSRSDTSVTGDKEGSQAASHNALEERIREVEVKQQAAVQEALIKQAERERSDQARLLRQVEQQQRVSLAIRDAKQRWTNVHEIANGELDGIRANREMLAVLCGTLDFYENQIHSRFTRVPTYVARLGLN